MERNKKAVVITAVLIIVSVSLIVFGICGDTIRNFVYQSQREYYPTKITDNDIGKKYRVPVLNGVLDVKPENFYLQAVADPDVTEENYIAFWFGLDMGKISPKKTAMFLSAAANCEECCITGVLRKYDSEFEQQVSSSLEVQIGEYYDENEEIIKECLNEITREKFIENELSTFTTYYFEVTNVHISAPINGVPYIVTGSAVLFFSLIFEICFVFKLKKRKVIPSVFAALIVISGTASVILFDHIRTAVSVKKVGPGIYTMKNYECTNTQGMIDANMQSIDDFVDWVLISSIFHLKSTDQILLVRHLQRLPLMGIIYSAEILITIVRIRYLFILTQKGHMLLSVWLIWHLWR